MVLLVTAFTEFQAGNFFMGSTSLILDLSAPLKITKVIKNADKIADGWKVYQAVKIAAFKIIDAGGNKILNNLPQDWKVTTSKKFIKESSESKGWEWTNPGRPDYHIRAMSGNPNSIYPHSRIPITECIKATVIMINMEIRLIKQIRYLTEKRISHYMKVLSLQ